jgi:SAM-dependent methyltransferase
VTGEPRSADIFAGQPGDADLLAAIYDLEHDDVTQDLGFYRELTRRGGGAVLDLGCGSGRLLGAFVAGGASRVVGIDGSPALLRRAEARVRGDPRLSALRDAGDMELLLGDVRRPRVGGPFRLAVGAGVLPHLDGPEDAVRMLAAVASCLDEGGLLVLDDIGPGALPSRDLPLSVDWRRELDGRPIVRRSQLAQRETPEGLRVDYATLTDAVRPDGTIARLPASFRLWYPSLAVLQRLLESGGLVTETTYGSYDLDSLDEESERRIVIARRAARPPGG